MIEIVTVGMLLVMAGGVFSGFPVALVLTGSGILGFFAAVMMGLSDFQHLGLFYLRLRGTLTNEGIQFTSVPLLILLGMVLNGSGIASTIFHTLGHMLRGVRGRYAIATLLVGLILAPAAGVIGASVITVALVAYHPMLNAGYSPRAAGGAVAASGALGVIFPPAIMLFFIATFFRLRLSVVYMSMIVPVLLLVVLFSVYFICTISAKDSEGSVAEGTEKPQYFSMIVALAVIASIPWSIVSGIATLSEAAGVGVFGALFLVAVRGQLSLTMLHNAIMQTGTLTAMVFFIVVGATVFSLSFHLVGGPGVLFDWITGFDLNRWETLGLLLGLVFILGFVFDWMEILLVFLPIFLPVFQQLDFVDHVGSAYAATVWLGALVALTLQSSFLTPPFGYALFFAKMTAPASVSLADIYRGAIPLVLLEIVLLVLVVVFPALVIWLPQMSLNLAQLAL